MGSAGRWAGWIVAVVALGVAAGALYVMQRNAQEMAGLRDSIAQSEARIGDLVQQAKGDAETIQRLEDTVARLEKQAAQAEAPSGKPGENAAAAAPSPGEDSGLFGKMAAALLGKSKAASEDQGQSDFFSGISKMFSGEKGPEFAKMSADMTVPMAYGPLLDQLHLSPEVEQQAREIISRNIAEQITSGMKLMEQKASPESMKQAGQDADAKLREELAAILSPEELAAYDEYQKELPRRMMQQQMQMQMSMFAPSMSPENQARAVDVFVEEMVPADGAGGFGQDLDIQGQFVRQRDAFARARERLAQEFEPEQLQMLDRFIEQQQQMLDMASRLFGVGKEQAPASKQ